MAQGSSVFLGKVGRVEAVLAIAMVVGAGAWFAGSSTSNHLPEVKATAERPDPAQEWARAQLVKFEMDNGLNAGTIMTATALTEAEILSAITACTAANLSQADVDAPVTHNCQAIPSVIQTFARRHESDTATASDRAKDEPNKALRNALLSIADYEKKSGLDEVALLDATGLEASELAGLVMACMEARPGTDCHDVIFSRIRVKTRQR